MCIGVLVFLRLFVSMLHFSYPILALKQSVANNVFFLLTINAQWLYADRIPVYGVFVDVSVLCVYMDAMFSFLFFSLLFFS